jgi:hypothetical protein
MDGPDIAPPLLNRREGTYFERRFELILFLRVLPCETLLALTVAFLDCVSLSGIA